MSVYLGEFVNNEQPQLDVWLAQMRDAGYVVGWWHGEARPGSTPDWLDMTIYVALRRADALPSARPERAGPPAGWLPGDEEW